MLFFSFFWTVVKKSIRNLRLVHECIECWEYCCCCYYVTIFCYNYVTILPHYQPAFLTAPDSYPHGTCHLLTTTCHLQTAICQKKKFCHNIFFPPWIFFTRNFYQPEIFIPLEICFRQNFSLERNFFGQKFFVLTKKVLAEFFSQNYFWPEIFSCQKITKLGLTCVTVAAKGCSPPQELDICI